MTPAVAAAALEFGQRHSRDRCGIVFFGGEPLLCKDLIGETVSRARALTQAGGVPCFFKLTTNGLLLDPEFVDFSTKQGIVIAVSIDGTQECHDRHRRTSSGAPSYERVRRNLAVLLAAKPYSHVIQVVSPDTVHQLAESVTSLLELGCRYIISSLNYAADWTDDSLEVLRQQYEVLAQRYIAWTQEGRKFYFSPFETKLASHIDNGRFRKDRCALGNRQLSVNPEGFLFPCVQFPRASKLSEFCLGHVQTGLDEAALERVRRLGRTEPEGCRDCALKARCNYTCACLNWQTTGSVSEVASVLCRHEQLLFPIVDALGAKLHAANDPHFLHKHYNPGYPLLSLLEDQR